MSLWNRKKIVTLHRNFAVMGSEVSSNNVMWLAQRFNLIISTNKMYVIVEIQGQQFKAEKGKFLYVHYLGEQVKVGETVEFDRVLLAEADGAVKVGAPTVEGAKVICEVCPSTQIEGEHLVKGEKVIVFKKKRRKGYRRKNGHRQYFTKVVIKDIVA